MKRQISRDDMLRESGRGDLLNSTHVDLFSGIGGFAIVPQVAYEILEAMKGAA